MFWHIFVIGKISMGGGGRVFWSSSPGYAYAPIKENKKMLQIFREVSGVFQQNFYGSKNSAVLEPRTGQFLRS